MESIAKIDFSWKSFLKNFGINCSCFVDALGAVFSDCLCLVNKLETKRFFVKNRISSPGSGGADRGVF